MYVCVCAYLCVYYIHAGFIRPEESVCTSGAGVSGCLMLPNGGCLNLNPGPLQEPIHANNQTIPENTKISKRTNYGYNLYGLNFWAPLVTNYVPVHAVRSLVWIS